MKYTIQILLVLILFLGCNSQTTDENIKPSSPTDKYRLIWNDNPQTTMTVGWNQKRGKGVVFYGLNRDMNNSIAPTRNVNFRGMKNSFARLKKLKPNSRYYFKICTENNCSELMYFKTAPKNNKAFTFISGGDSRSIPRGRIQGNILVSKIRPLFIAHGGDFTMKGSSEEWQRWLDEWQLTKSPDGRIYPLIVTHGNHENGDREMLYNLFDVPSKDVYYKINFPLLSLYILNTELEPSVAKYAFKTRDPQKWNEQKKWLKERLKVDKKLWKIISYHRPLRPHRASKSEGKLRYSDWAWLFYNHGVQLAIESDSHLVKYTQPLKPDKKGEEGFVVDKKRGTTYIGEGSWGAPTRVNDDDKSWTLDSGSFWQFKLITVDVNRLEIRTVKFGDEDSDYDAKSVNSTLQEAQNKNPKIIPNNLDLWKSKAGEVLMIKSI